MHDNTSLQCYNYRQETRVHKLVTCEQMTEHTEHTGNVQNKQQSLMHNNACHIVNCKL